MELYLVRHYIIMLHWFARVFFAVSLVAQARLLPKAKQRGFAM